MENKVQLITYVDRFGAGDIADLATLLNGQLNGTFGGVHLLPFYHPFDGADTGFDPIDHGRVDSRLGSWADIKNLSGNHEICADLIVNHISADSHQFLDFNENGAESDYAGMFNLVNRLYPNGYAESDLNQAYRPKPGNPIRDHRLNNGETTPIWSTFSEQQIDIDVEHPVSRDYLLRILRTMAKHGVKLVRFDAVGYSIKKPNSSCFMLPETLDYIEQLGAAVRELGMQVLVEIHSHHSDQIKTANIVDWVYDFALPPLVLHTLFFGSTRSLKSWLAISPRNAITVLDTHDGIGVTDAGPSSLDPSLPGLINQQQLDALVTRIHENTDGLSQEASGPGSGNLDIYQINCTFYDALNRSNQAYFIARLIQFFSPGIPQVYYVGLLAGNNDDAFFRRSGSGRNLHRPVFSLDEINSRLDLPMVRALLALIHFRNQHPAFQGGFSLLDSADSEIHMCWQNGKRTASLLVDAEKQHFVVTFDQDDLSQCNFSELADFVSWAQVQTDFSNQGLGAQ